MMGDFEPGTWSWPVVVTLVVAVVIGLLGVWAMWRWGNRRRVLTVRLTSNPVIHPNAPIDGLEVRFRGNPVASPYSAELVVTNTGGADISTSAFDAARPIRIHLNRAFYGVSETSGNLPLKQPQHAGDPADDVLEIGPGLLKRGHEWSCSFIVSGEPVLRPEDVEAPLIDVRFRVVKDVYTTDQLLDAVLGISSSIPLGGLVATTISLSRMFSGRWRGSSEAKDRGLF